MSPRVAKRVTVPLARRCSRKAGARSRMSRSACAGVVAREGGSNTSIGEGGAGGASSKEVGAVMPASLRLGGQGQRRGGSRGGRRGAALAEDRGERAAP